MRQLPPMAVSSRIALLKERFGDDLTFEDFGLRSKVYQKVAEEHPGVSAGRRIALSFAQFLREKDVSIREYDLLAGKLRFYGYSESIPVRAVSTGAGIMHKKDVDLHPMFLNAELFDASEEIAHCKASSGLEGQDGALLDEFYTALQSGSYNRWASGHVIAGYEKAVRRGIGGLIREGEEALRTVDEAHRDCVEAMLITDRAAREYILRYRDAALKALEKTENPEYKKSLERIADACGNICENPPQSFFEAVQLLMLLHDLIICESVSGSISLGRVDYILYPYYKKDFEEGKITFEEASDYIDALWLKFGQLMEGFQNVTLGGCHPDGSFAGNEVTVMGLRASRKTMLDQPLISYRCHPDMPDLFWDEVQDLVQTGLGFPAMFNDEIVFRAKEAAGVKPEDCWNYGIVGCVEPAIGGSEYSRTEELRVSWAKPLELMLTGGVCACTGEKLPLKTRRELGEISSFEEFYQWYREELAYASRLGMKACNLLDATYGTAWPIPFLSSTMAECYQKGEDATRGGTAYCFSTLNACGMADAVDSLCAIREVVFEKHLLTLPQLADLLKADFEGNEPLRLLLSNLPERFGNGKERADRMMKELCAFFVSLGQETENPFGNHFQAGLYTVSSHAGMGAKTGALPTGRHKGVSLANALSPCQGADRLGPTAVIRSVTGVDHSVCGNGMVLDLKFNPGFFKKPSHRQGVRSLIETYFDKGGMEVQFNVVSRETLLAAKADPQKYRNLIVRVSGFSAYFFHLDPVLQDEIIARTEYAG